MAVDPLHNTLTNRNSVLNKKNFWNLHATVPYTTGESTDGDESFYVFCIGLVLFFIMLLNFDIHI